MRGRGLGAVLGHLLSLMRRMVARRREIPFGLAPLFQRKNSVVKTGHDPPGSRHNSPYLFSRSLALNKKGDSSSPDRTRVEDGTDLTRGVRPRGTS